MNPPYQPAHNSPFLRFSLFTFHKFLFIDIFIVSVTHM